LALSPDSHWLASGLQPPDESSGWPLLLWNLADEEPEPVQLNFQGEFVMRGTFHPDSNLLAASTATGKVRVWRLSEEEVKNDPLDAGGPIVAHAFSPDGRFLAVAGCDLPVVRPSRLPNCLVPYLTVLDLENGRPLSRSFAGHTRAILSLAFSPDGSLLASGDVGGDIMLWDLSVTPEAMACRQAGRNMTGAEWERYFGEEPYWPTCPGLAAPSR
jgi:WD40 repeat protein